MIKFYKLNQQDHCFQFLFIKTDMFHLLKGPLSWSQTVYKETYTQSNTIMHIGFTLSQATKTLRESRGTALLYFRPLHQKGVRSQRHAPEAPYPWERPGTHCTGGWVDPRAGLDWCGKSRPTGIRSPDRPARRQSQLCTYRVKIYDTVDVRHKITPYTLPKLQIFKIHTHSCFNESKCYSTGTYTLKGQGCEKSTTK